MPSTFVSGSDDVQAAFKLLEKKVARKIVAKVSRVIMKEDVLPSAMSKVPFLTGALHDALVVRAAKLKRGSKSVGSSVQTREGMFQGEEFYGGFQEYGWKHWRNGWLVPANPFLRPALYEDQNARLKKFNNLFMQLLDPEVRKMGVRQFKKLQSELAAKRAFE